MHIGGFSVTGNEHAQITSDEAAIEKQYRDGLAGRARKLRGDINDITANTWTTSVDIEIPDDGELIGRVALRGPNDDFLDGRSDFYIGTTSHDGGDYQVFSWIAPVACTYYRKFSDHHDLCDEVAGVRVLAHRGGQIMDHQDEIMSGNPISNLFPKRQLQVPRAPRLSTKESPTQASEANPAAATNPGDAEETLQPLVTPSADATEKSVPSRASVAPRPDTPPGLVVRTPDLLRRQLAAPKSVAMSAVLATLQSDQYEAITRPVSESQVLQGHPGTGKTIIAAHRAAYLLNAEAPESAKPKGQVWILGPTAEYVKHIQGVLGQLIDRPGSYVVKDMPAVLEDLAGLPRTAIPTGSPVLADVSQELARLVDRALEKAKADPGKEKVEQEDAYQELLWFLQEPPSDGLDPEWVAYLRKLPPTLKELRGKNVRAYRGLLAYIAVRTMRTPDPGHVIVDEAQDIHPIEWEILGRLGNVGGWTILGDLNQRRTDHTFGSWDEVAALLAIEKEDGEAPLQVLEVGYRSTAQIIKFANQLLPTRERSLYSLQQDGEAPSVRRSASARDLYDTSFAAAEDLLDRVGSGTVAVITVNPDGFNEILRRRGWNVLPGDLYAWRQNDKNLRVLPPDRARGLEFDGVVVVEPADFPENFGRQGVLFTALTRANRLLTVVNHRALPGKMKAHL